MEHLGAAKHNGLTIGRRCRVFYDLRLLAVDDTPHLLTPRIEKIQFTF